MSAVVVAVAANQLQRDARIKLAEEHIKAENDHDMNRIIDTFGSDSKFFLNGMTLEGHDNIRACYESFEVSACAIFCFDAKGKLESERVYFDMSAILKQIGII